MAKLHWVSLNLDMHTVRRRLSRKPNLSYPRLNPRAKLMSVPLSLELDLRIESLIIYLELDYFLSYGNELKALCATQVVPHL